MKFDQKEWAKVIAYFIPVLALVIANVFQISDVAEIQNRLTAIITVGLSFVAGIISLIGIVRSHDKKK